MISLLGSLVAWRRLSVRSGHRDRPGHPRAPRQRTLHTRFGHTYRRTGKTNFRNLTCYLYYKFNWFFKMPGYLLKNQTRMFKDTFFTLQCFKTLALKQCCVNQNHLFHISHFIVDYREPPPRRTVGPWRWKTVWSAAAPTRPMRTWPGSPQSSSRLWSTDSRYCFHNLCLYYTGG